MKLCRFAALLFALLLLSACGGIEYAADFLAMDTVMRVSVYGRGGQDAADAAAAEIKSLEKLLSATNQDSEVYAANHSRGPVTVSQETAALLARALELCGETGGALDVTIYPAVKAWGFTTGSYQVPEGDALDALLENVDYTRIVLDGDSLTVPEGMELDLGAVAKGYAADRAAAVLAGQGVKSAKLKLGGNIHLIGSKPDGTPWRIAVRDPSGEGYAGILEVSGGAVVTSGGYERYFEQDGITYWHILDPATGRPARSGLVSATVTAESGTLADALSTALFVMGRERAEALWRERQDFNFVLIEEDGTVAVTPGLAEHFTLTEDWSEHRVEVVKE